MYQKAPKTPVMNNLPLFLDSTLNADNRWVKLAGVIPWELVDEIYARNFESEKGPKALPSRIAFGALIIQLKLNLTDDETVNQIAENPYLQYFIGLEQFQYKKPFDSSMLTHFRKRFDAVGIDNVNDLLHQNTQKKSTEDSSSDDDEDNKGQLIVDATCAPADIHFPTDLGLLNKAREKTEKIIDLLWESSTTNEFKVKPRTYRKKGRQSFLGIIKLKRPGKKKIRKAICYQLNCVRRNLASIELLKAHFELKVLKKSLYKDLLVINHLYKQQQEMYAEQKHSIPDRIVSISQPHVRPIVRGKAAAKTEFGAKVSISVVDGWSFVDTINFDAYNEGTELQWQIEKYKNRFGHYPKSVHADKIYRNRDNLKFCKAHGIRLSGPKLGRNPKDPEKLKAVKELERADEGVRNEVEGKFGIAKRRYGLAKIMTKLQTTSATVISLIFLIMNLDRVVLFSTILCTIFLRAVASMSSIMTLVNLKGHFSHWELDYFIQNQMKM